MGNPLRLRRSAGTKDPLLRGFIDEVALVINSLISRQQIRRTDVAGVPQFSVRQPIATAGGLEYNGSGCLTIKLNTTILNLAAAGLGFANQPPNTVLAGPATGGSGPVSFRTLAPADVVGNTVSTLNGLSGNVIIADGANTVVVTTVANETIQVNVSLGNSVTGLGNATVKLVGNVTLLGSGLTVTAHTGNQTILFTSTGGGGSSSYTAPTLANFTWTNQGAGNSSVIASGGFAMRRGGASGAQELTILHEAISAAPWVMEAGYLPLCGTDGDFGLIGLVLYDTGTGKAKQIRFGGREDGGKRVDVMVQNFDDVNLGAGLAFGNETVNEYRGERGAYWIRIEDDNTDWKYSYGAGPDGPWFEFFNEPRNTHLTADRIGMSLNPFDASAGSWLFHWKRS